MNKKLYPAAIAAVVLCALLAFTIVHNTAAYSGNGEQTAHAQESAEGAEGSDQQAAQESAEGAEGSDQQAAQESAEGAEGSDQQAGQSEPPEDSEAAPAQDLSETDSPLSVTETEEYTEKILKVVGAASEEQTAAVRFYKESPNVPYMGIGEYFDLMLGGGLTVKADGDGVYTLTNAAGAQAVVDIGKGTVSAQDMPAFENYFDEAREGKAGSFKDSDAPYLRLREVVYEDEPTPVVFELGKLGIALHADEDEVWFPVAILSSWLTDIAQNLVVCNGDRLYVCREKSAYEMDNGYFNTEYFDKILTGSERAEDLAAYSYAELGFIFRYMYGYPGRSELDPEILRGEGFDEALEALGEEGQALRGELSSRDFKDFWFAMFKLSDGPMEDGHNNTTLSIGVVDADQTDRYKDFRTYTWSKFDNLEMSEFVKNLSAASGGIYSVRPEELSTNRYYKCGDTAVILLNGFTVDAQGWNSYYSGGGELPEDTMGVAARGLKKASEDEGIRNVVFDLSTNPGGYSDAAMGVLSLMTGRDYLNGYNEQSRQAFKVYFDVDRNLDGEINEEDDKVNYDFNYAVMTSGASFSCGNMFPFLVKEEGGMVIGERSGGGSCSIQKAALSEGFEISVSGCKFKLADGGRSDFEQGVTPDIPLEVGVKKEINEITGEVMESPDYSAFGDLDGVCRTVSGYFQ
ncbi:MAG: hypothetical protein IJ198_14200 [Lachnospiraceae bacterium]|nr:hypothetical protein [Lachnospiraceae bacterium]